MDFIESLNINYDKLRNKDIVNTLWMEILNEKRSEEYLDQLIEYSFHYPVDSDTYLQELNEKFDALDKEELRVIDGHLRAYMITFLYYCTNRYNRRVPVKTTMLASSLYMKLISIPQIGKIFYEKNMLKVQLFVCINSAKEQSVPESSKIYLLKLIKKFCLLEEPDLGLLKGTMNTFVGVLMICCKDRFDTINNEAGKKPLDHLLPIILTDPIIIHVQFLLYGTELIHRQCFPVPPLPAYCINCIKEIILNEDDNLRLTGILESLFRCLRSGIVQTVPNGSASINIITVFIRDILQLELDEDKFQYLLDAFCLIWGCEDFNSYNEAVVIMNLFKVQYYKELVRRMVLYSQSKNHKRYLLNVMNLLIATCENLPSFPLKKVEVLFSCVLRNIIFHFIDEDKRVANTAIEVVMKICRMKDNPMLNSIFNHIRSSGKFINISVEALLLSLNQIVDEKWGTSPRNQNLLVIMARFLADSHNVNNELVQKTLNAICKDCTPFSLKPSLPILHELFCVMALKEEIAVAQAVLKIIFKSAMHQDATSVGFSDHIFKSMLNPSVIDNITYPPKYYYNIFLTSEFEYEALFAKCQKNIREEHIEQMIRDLDNEEPGGAVLVCCLLNYCKYEETTVLADYFIQNFSEIATRATMGPLSIAFNKILANKTLSEQDIPQLDVLQSLIMEGLFEQTFQVPCIKPAFNLLQEIRKLLRIDLEDQILNQLLVVTSEKAFRRLHRREIGDNSVFMYLNELCLLMRKPPTEYVIRLLESYMEDSTRIQELTMFMPDIYIQLLTLFATLAMMNKKKVPLALSYLRGVLYDEQQIIQILSFKLFYSLCQEMTHEYEEVITFVFREIVRADPCLIRICVIAIEELIHEDFVKLCAEDFFRFVYVLGCEDLVIFMKDVLMKRFVLSNQNDIAKFYVQTIVHIHMYSKLSNYPISPQFDEDLVRIKLRMNTPNEILSFLFNVLPIRKKFNVLCEISSIFEDLMLGQCKIENNFFNMLKDLILSFKFLATSNIESISDKHYYDNVCKQIEKQIVNRDPSFETQSYYGEYETEIKRCTLTLLKLLFFENNQVADVIQVILFDTVIHWIDFVKAEIINYLHVERGKEYGQYFSKLVQYYKRNKSKFVTTNR